MKHLGIDFGEKRVGVAVSNDAGTIAFPKLILKNDLKLLDALVAYAEEQGVREIVFGESKDFMGQENLIMREVRKCASALELAGFSVHFEPEFLSSHQFAKERFGMDTLAQRRSDGRPGRKAATRDPIDASVAAIILQSFLEKRKNK